MAAIALEGLTKRYGDVRANDCLTLDVQQGEIFGYLGPNGAGKTTTIRLLLGFITPTAGQARVLGTDVTDRRGLVSAKHNIGYLPDEPEFDSRDTGREVLNLHERVKGGQRRGELLELFEPPLDREIREYSRGNVRKLGLVTTFMHDPDLVILDEPTSGLDPLLQQRFGRFLRAERDRGVTVFFSSHILSEVRRLCDRVGIIREGQLVEVSPVETLLDRTGKVIRLESADPIPADVFRLDGVSDLTVSTDPADLDSLDTVRECTFTFTGNISALLGRLSEYELVDLTIEEAPLEDVFLKFYGDDSDA
ncbi:ABC transporter ATP-binding protein [Halovenus halobia]|uniref:ABC transporter ATP-binding protein n=1 Tax=Halovenus halobia TaxID=3396622 RepID=UPI003F578CC3